MLIGIPCMVMRGGTSKGPFFLASDLPDDTAQLNRTLLAVMGSEHIRQIDGIGGGDSLTSKAVIVGPSERPGIDVEYLFAQVAVGGDTVDTAPNCGNMLSAVGPFAIERGLVPATSPQTTLRIFNRNTGKTIEAIVQTPDGKVTYEGKTAIDGVAGHGAPVVLNFLDAAGAKTGKLPTGKPIDVINGINSHALTSRRHWCSSPQQRSARRDTRPRLRSIVTRRCSSASKRSGSKQRDEWDSATQPERCFRRLRCSPRRRAAAVFRRAI
jgi:2-methylaconitate cis-trans-isomerase PrpF